MQSYQCLSQSQAKIFSRMIKLGICDFMQDSNDDSLMTEHEIIQFEKYCSRVKNRQRGTSIRELSHFLTLHCIRQDSTGRCLNSAYKAGLPLSVYHNPSQNTPLHVASYRGFPDVAKIAIEAGVDVSVLDSQGREAIFYAVQGTMNTPGIGTETDYYKIFKMIAGAKGGVHKCHHYVSSGGKRQPLIFVACEVGAVKIVRDLINSGADVNERDSMELDRFTQLSTGVTCLGETPLHYAAKSGNLKLVKLLLKNGADTRKRSYGAHATLPVEKILNGSHNMRIANEIFRWEKDYNIDCNDTPPVPTGRVHSSDVNIVAITDHVKTFLETGEITGQVSSMPMFKVQNRDTVSGEIFVVEKHENELDSKTIGMKKCAKCEKVLPDLKQCSRCKTAHYCNSVCQKDHWKEHKKVCTKM